MKETSSKEAERAVEEQLKAASEIYALREKLYKQEAETKTMMVTDVDEIADLK